MKKFSLLYLVFSMAIFGTIGILRSYIPFPSGFLAMMRGLIGSAFILLFLTATKRGINLTAIKKNFWILTLSGAFIGINWILLFEAYKHTTVAIATLCYYMSPLFVMVASSVFLKEKLTFKKMLCILTAIFGMMLVSGITDSKISGTSGFAGIFLGLSAALFYASVTLISKKAKDISSLDMTLVQLFSAAITVMPYSLIFEDISFSKVPGTAIGMVFTVGVIHTGIAYIMYFTSVKNLETSRVAIFSYLDPIIAIFLSVLILREEMTVITVIGATLILISAFTSEINFTSFKKRTKIN